MVLNKLLILTRPLRYWFDKISYRLSPCNEEIKKLHGSIEGKPLLIVGNGPSLNQTPLESFDSIFSIGMNKIDMIFEKTTWRPDVIITTNNLVVKQHWSRMLKNRIPCYISWKARFFVPFFKRKKFRFFLNNNNRDFQCDVSKSVGAAGTVTYTALQFAYYLGANPVILVGVDHNFTYDGKPNDIQKRIGQDQNHFDPNYFASGQYWGVPNLDLSEVGYENAKEAFEKDGRKIFDATVGGKLQVFEKISVDDAISLFTEGHISD
jgi:hypothetical protein